MNYFYYFVNNYPIIFYFIFFQPILGAIAHNVPAVYDVLAARIEKCVAFLGPTKCGCSEPWEWSVAE
jgi:hypothetical protein